MFIVTITHQVMTITNLGMEKWISPWPEFSIVVLMARIIPCIKSNLYFTGLLGRTKKKCQLAKNIAGGSTTI